MPRKKKKPIKKIIVEETVSETPLEEKVKEVVPEEESEAKKAFRVFIKRYKEQNPVKYKLKEAELLTKLNTL